MFLETATKEILDFQQEADDFRQIVDETPSSRQLPGKRLRGLSAAAKDTKSATVRLLDSLRLIELTGLDVVDMETRMMGEAKELARSLKEIGEMVHDQHFVRVRFENELVRLEERAQTVAGALFPSAVQGLNLVNSKLWEFSRLQMSRYRRILGKVVEEEKLSGPAQKQVETSFAELEKHFENANRFLNQLALRQLKRRGVVTRYGNVKRALAAAEVIAEKMSAKKSFRDFESVLKASRTVASSVAKRLGALRIPLFPSYDQLEELKPSIDQLLYEGLTGLQTFALLNITARMRHVTVGRGHLLSPRFKIQIWQVFPDRIYLDADARFLKAVEKAREFGKAEAALLRFRDGSFKQRAYQQGNLQVSYQRNPDGRVSVDADIDLYRNPLVHFFGEVLVNHLTGVKTDPYRVHDILEGQGVEPIGGFEIRSG